MLLNRLQQCRPEKLKEKVKRTTAFAPSERASHDVVSYATHSDAITLSSQRRNGTFIQTESDFVDQDGRDCENQYLTTPDWPDCSFIVRYEGGPHDVESFFCKLTYCFKVSIGVKSNASLTVDSLLDTGSNPNSIKKDFLPRAWKESDKYIKSLQFRTGNSEVLNIEGIIPCSFALGSHAYSPGLGFSKISPLWRTARSLVWTTDAYMGYSLQSEK